MSETADRSRHPGQPSYTAMPPAAPPPLTPAALQRCLRAAVFGHRIFYYPVVGSTNDRALELSAAGEPEGSLVLAERQTAGRGRRERTWASAERLGIYASLVLRPACPAARAPLFTFMAAVAVADAVREVCRLPAGIKWPNDVLVGGGKIAGVLGEIRGGEAQIRDMVIGLGINVAQRHEDFPGDLLRPATSVRIEGGASQDRAAILACVLEGFERRYARTLKDGTADLLREWEALSVMPRGQRVLVGGPDGRREATIAGVDDDGALLLEGPNGAPSRLPFGEQVEPIAG